MTLLKRKISVILAGRWGRQWKCFLRNVKVRSVYVNYDACGDVEKLGLSLIDAEMAPIDLESEILEMERERAEKYWEERCKERKENSELELEKMKLQIEDFYFFV